MAITIRDFVLKLGFDASEVDRGLSQIENRLRRVGRAQTSAVNRQVTAEQRVARVRQNTETSLERAQQNRLRREANALISNARTRQRLDNARNDSQLRALRLQAQVEAGLRDRRNAPATRSTLSGIGGSITGILGGLASAETAQEVRDLNRQLTALRDRLTQAGAAQRRMNRELSVGRRASEGFRQSLNNLGRSYVSVFAVIAGGAAAVNVGQQLIQLQASLLAASNGAAEARSNFEFLKGISLQLGADLTQTTKGFQQFGVSAKAAGFETAEIRSLFTQATQAAVAFGLSADDQAGVFRARLMAPCIETCM